MEKHTTKTVSQDILIRLKNGDKTAFESVYWTYNSYIFNFISSLLYDKSLAEDLTQNVFLKIWEKHETIDPSQAFNAYLFTIARNLVYKDSESRLLFETATVVLSRQSFESDSLMEEKIEAESLREYIDSLIEQLPPARKNIFQLSRQKHLSNKEIAEKLSLSEKTVETQLYRALQFLKQRLSSDNLLAILLLLLIRFHSE